MFLTTGWDKFLLYLMEAGFRVSRTHFDPTGIRTDAKLEQFKSVLTKYSVPTYTNATQTSVSAEKTIWEFISADKVLTALTKDDFLLLRVISFEQRNFSFYLFYISLINMVQVWLFLAGLFWFYFFCLLNNKNLCSSMNLLILLQVMM